MWKYAKKLLARFPAVAATKAWQILAAVATVLGLLGVVKKSLQNKVLDAPFWLLVLLGVAVLVYTVFATAYEEWKDRPDSEGEGADKEALEVAKASADANLVSADAYRSLQETIDTLHAGEQEANDELKRCMEQNAELREEIARLESREDG